MGRETRRHRLVVVELSKNKNGLIVADRLESMLANQGRSEGSEHDESTFDHEMTRTFIPGFCWSQCKGSLGRYDAAQVRDTFDPRRQILFGE